MRITTKILLCLGIVIAIKYTNVLILEYYLNDNNSRVFSENKTVEKIRYVLDTGGCRIPKYDPFDPTVKMHYKKMTGDIQCKGKRYLTVVNNVVIVNALEVERDYPEDNFTCSYEEILRNPDNNERAADNVIGYGEMLPLFFGETLEEEFVRVSCYVDSQMVHMEFLATTPIKEEVAERCKENEENTLVDEPKVDVLIVGIDSVSKLNFQRHFKITSEYLRNNLSAFEFNGYVKVADNTFPNLTPMLTGQFVEYYYNSNNSKMYFDDLDFMWKQFSSIGYKTLLAEDAPTMGIYNYAKYGFQYPPTDYYFRPFTFAMEDTKWQKNSKVDCYQANPEIRVVFDYLRSFLTTTGDEPYFALVWPSRLTHNDLNKAGYADRISYKLLKDLNDMGIFNRSMVIFVSDHGIRFGNIRNTFIGKIEERMPFFFLSLPSWFKKRYPNIEEGLRINQDRLTTPFDIHETFQELFEIVSGIEPNQTTQYGNSLFHPISPNRTCEDAFILPHWCTCYRFLRKPTNHLNVIKSTKVLLNTLNNWTEPHRDVCERLVLEKITDSLVSLPTRELLKYNAKKPSKKKKSNKKQKKKNRNERNKSNVEIADYLITIKTLPGHLIFEATVRRTKGVFHVLDVSRLDEYGHHGDCVDDFNLRKYCHCKSKVK